MRFFLMPVNQNIVYDLEVMCKIPAQLDINHILVKQRKVIKALLLPVTNISSTL